VVETGGLPLHAIADWKDWWNGRPLAEIQTEIRAADPTAVLADARRLLDAGTTTIERAERALEMLTRGQRLAKDRAGFEAFTQLIRFAHRQRIRLLSEVSGVRALQQARASLDTLGADPDILGDATELALDHGEPADAMAFYQSLLATSADHARKVKDKLGQRLRQKATLLLRDRRNQESAQLLAAAIRNLPGRADLRMLYAQALSRLGDDVTARIQADEAARLDRSYTNEARRYARTTGRTGRGQRVEIRYDKRSGSINVAGTAGGQAVGFIVDTGASYTTIPTSVAKALNLLHAKNPIVQVTTAGVVLKARRVVVPSLTIAGKITVHKVTALVMDLPGSLAGKGLLGMNVLGTLNMESRSGRLILWRGGKRR
jgi:clan AA aspartic protease (TIGR02281 family)